MYIVEKTLEISACHNLKLDYESKCENLHGHNWIITITCASEKLDNNGMVYDFTQIKKIISSKLDHSYLNEMLVDINPTAENIAKWIAETIGKKCIKVKVQESEGNVAIYEV